jgi:hypothetical protein
MNKSILTRIFAVTLLAGGTLLSHGGTPDSPGMPPAATKHWTADNGNGTYSNPLFYEEFEDPDPIRVGDDYYLASTTMHMNPAVIIMHSEDLVNWELAGYCMDRLDLGPAFRVEGGQIYGNGIWAPCIRYHDGMFYVFCNVNRAGLQIFRSKSASGPWQRNQIPGFHDLSVLFDDDGKIYLVYPSGAKTDPLDAELLLQILLQHRDRLKAWQPDEPVTRQLQLLVEARRRFVADRVRLSNRLENALKSYFPQALQLVGQSLTTPMACAFLQKWPTLAAVQKAGPQRLRKFYCGQHSRAEELIRQRLQLLVQAKPLAESSPKNARSHNQAC